MIGVENVFYLANAEFILYLNVLLTGDVEEKRFKFMNKILY